MKVPVDECPAGAAMDAAVARAMGWEWDEYIWWDGEDFVPHFEPSEDIVMAWSLFLKLPEDRVLEVGTGNKDNEGWLSFACIRFGGESMGTSGYEDGDTGWAQDEEKNRPCLSALTALAISRAFLLANGITEIEVEDA